MKTIGNYTVCFEGHLPMRVFASSFKRAVEVAIFNINTHCHPFNGEKLVTPQDLNIVYLP